jgi:hypothetical protein
MKSKRTLEWLAAVDFLLCIVDLLFVAVASQRRVGEEYYYYVRDFFGLRWHVKDPRILTKAQLRHCGREPLTRKTCSQNAESHPQPCAREFLI